MVFEPMQIGKRSFDFKRPYVVGILNVTPDSFYDGGKYFSVDLAVERGLKMVAEGADIIDVGGESTRPGSKFVSPEEEIRRVVPVIEKLSRQTDVPISIDTTKSIVAREAISSGACMINDISGLRFDPEIAQVAREFGVPLVIMHSRETPEKMQENVHYDNLQKEILEELERSIKIAISYGVSKNSIIVDPGIGFAKTAKQNLEIIWHLDFLSRLQRPILIGPSRKSFIAVITGASAEERIGGTAAAVAIAISKGANFVRVHDVFIMKQVMDVAFAMSNLMKNF